MKMRPPVNDYCSSNDLHTQNSIHKDQSSQEKDWNNSHTTTQTHKTKAQDYKIDPKLIPRPNHFDTIYRNKENSPIFETTEGATTPHSFAYHSVKETQNSSCRFIRSTLNRIPIDQGTLNGTSLMFGLYVQPFAELPDHENEVPKVEVCGQIFRCKRCNAYINSKFQCAYSNANRSVLVCNLCSYENELDSVKGSVKDEYFNSSIAASVPELSNPTVDFQVPLNLEHNIPFIPHYTFLIDISPLSIELGLPGYVLNSISANLDYFHFAENSFITIATYDFKTIHFFALDKSSDVKSYIVTDIESPFCPLPMNKLFVNVTSQKNEIEKLIERITVFINERYKDCSKKGPSGCCTGAAIHAGVDSLRENGGRVIVFTCSGCMSGYGACKLKEESKIMNTQNEKTLYLPQHSFFNQLAEICNENRIVIDQFIIANNQFDMATFSILSNLTGGVAKFYPVFNPKDISGVKTYFEKLHYDLSRILTRPNYYDVKFMLRYTYGIEPAEILGPFNKKLGDGFTIAGCDPDYSFAYHLKLSESFGKNQRVHFQLVCLYIDNFNKRYLRVFNYTTIATGEIASIFLNADVDVLSKITIMKEISMLYQTDIATVRENISNRVISSFHYYKIHCSNDMSSSQLLLPASIKYYPLYLNSFIKKGIVRQNKIGIPSNYITSLINKFMRDPVDSIMKFLYPELFRVDDIQCDQSPKFRSDDEDHIIENVGMINERYSFIQKPVLLPLSLDYIEFDCAYLMNDGEVISLFIFNSINEAFYQELFNVSSWEEACNQGVEALDESNQNDLNVRILNIVGQMRKENKCCTQPLKLFFLNEKTYSKPELTSMLIEDKTKDELKYVDFLCQLHEEIQKRMR